MVSSTEHREGFFTPVADFAVFVGHPKLFGRTQLYFLIIMAFGSSNFFGVHQNRKQVLFYVAWGRKLTEPKR